MFFREIKKIVIILLFKRVELRIVLFSMRVYREVDRVAMVIILKRLFFKRKRIFKD